MQGVLAISSTIWMSALAKSLVERSFHVIYCPRHSRKKLAARQVQHYKTLSSIVFDPFWVSRTVLWSAARTRCENRAVIASTGLFEYSLFLSAINCAVYFHLIPPTWRSSPTDFLTISGLLTSSRTGSHSRCVLSHWPKFIIHRRPV